MIRPGSLLLLAALLTSCAGSRGELRALKDAGRDLYARAQNTVVTVRLVIKVSVGGHDNETKFEVQGTVIDPSGLTLVPAATVDPSAVVRAMMSSKGGASEPKIESSVSETTLVLADGTELEADVIIKDVELDIAFVRPRDQSKPLQSVTLKAGRGLPQILDEVLVLGRFGRAQNRTPWVGFTEVRAIVKGPRSYALCDGAGEAAGTVAYSAQGEPVGVFVTHFGKASRGPASGAGGGSVILRPLEDAIDIAEAARKLKNPEPKTAPAAN